MKKSLVLGLALSLVMSLGVGCAPKTEAPAAPAAPAEKPAATEAEKPADQPAAPEKIYIPVISKGFQHQFWQAVKLGAERAAADYGVEISFEGPESETQVDKQLDMLQAALAKNPQAIALAALDSRAATPYLEKAEAAGIPVVGFDSGVDSPIVKTTAATDNYAAAGLAADKMAELIGGAGKVGLIVHDQTSQTGVDRRDGFVKTLEEKYPNIEVVPVQYGEGDHAKSTEAAKAIMTANPDIKGMFGANEGSIAGVINAAKELNKKDLVVIGFDSGKLLLDAIKGDLVSGAITQDPVGIGYKAVEAAYKAYKGETTPEFIDTGFKWYDKTNMDTPEIKEVLYE
ncbi:ABC transporter substrate-binding protein [Cellulosilyticum sp. I15G10I2]|uniref:ABC transporter substrate-binding protein n=1 Tax=Cellulosilyticum sp. I15G10I2 TaxID=1892843 RepID=UPI00085C3883|nr:ABC transporter substrate-binding protein [Cellulosilyticum sp. I15G10I2]